MVKVREHSPRLVDGSVDVDAWLVRIQNERMPDISRLRQACDLARTHGQGSRLLSGQPCIEQGLQMAELLADLRADEEVLMCAVIYPLVATKHLTTDMVLDALGGSVNKLVCGVMQMSVSHSLFDRDGIRRQSEQQQVENLRKMLLAMVEDVRVVLVKLAECVCAMRSAKALPEDERRLLSQEVMDIYAPLANRLGIGQIKWELEDLAFRYLMPEKYKQIAKLLDEKRLAREEYIRQITQVLDKELDKAGIKAEVHGRAKHIFSIWRKMRRKNLDYEKIYDVRAVRILVEDVKDCYAALGIVHSLWPHIPREFDDYIATPKENGYQSLHTAVIGPQRKSLEVQIRSHNMHQESELGVAAHWRYKEFPGSKASKNMDDKIAWLRQVLDWQAELVNASEFVTELHSQAFDDRVYVFTPRGDVVDLVVGATPLDFAYHIHTDVGHRCRGAKVNGRIVPLTYCLSSGETVEVLTSRTGEPSRDWLNPTLGYLKTTRARAKVHQWFRLQDYEKNLAEGRYQVDRELQRVGIDHFDLNHVIKRFNYQNTDDLLVGVGRGDVRLFQVVNAVQEHLNPQSQDDLALLKVKPQHQDRTPDTSGIRVQGETNVLTTIAGCCQPVPGDPVIGYVTRGRGVTIHRHDCPNVSKAQKLADERLIEVQWGKEEANTYPIDVYILAYDRQGLLSDITRVLTNEHVNVIGVNTKSYKEENIAEITITTEIASLEVLTRLLAKIGRIPNIFEVRRK